MNDQQQSPQLDTSKLLDQGPVSPRAQAFNEYVNRRLALTGASTMTTEQYEAFAAGWTSAIAYRGAADPRLADMAIDEGWIVETVDECTCGTGGLPGHMPGCGSIPVAPLDEVLDAHAIVNGAGTRRTVVTLYTVIVRYPNGSRGHVPASTLADAWARGDAEVRHSPGAEVERVDVVKVTSYQTIDRSEATR